MKMFTFLIMFSSSNWNGFVCYCVSHVHHHIVKTHQYVVKLMVPDHYEKKQRWYDVVSQWNDTMIYTMMY
jgi:hypothetical protein